MTDEHAALRAAFVARLVRAGCPSDPEWIRAFLDVPRHLFLPRILTSTAGGQWQAIDSDDPTYLGLVYADTTLTTQLDGAVDPDPRAGPFAGVGTSSSTQPGLMAYMLEALHITGTERILEIGTGTGYNAAIMAHRVGSENVTSIEFDPRVAGQARARLKACGYEPSVIIGDGLQGWPDGAPFDRVIATCSVPRVPRAWIEQTRESGHIVVSLWRDLGGGPLIKLTVGDGAARGFFLPEIGGFMPVRSVVRTSQQLKTAVKQDGQTGPAKVDVGVIREPDAGLWLALLVPGVTWLGFTPTGAGEQLWLFAPDGSWSSLDRTTGDVEQYGPRRLWDEVERAYGTWKGWGSPTRDRVGLTVQPDGNHRFWLDDEGNELWTDEEPRIGD